MPEQTKIWSIGPEDNLTEIQTSKLDQEKRIQQWVEKDIDIISNNLLVIGREVETAYGKYIDILCIDSQGDLVIVELKRDMTPREVTAQTLDYASWVCQLSVKEINQIAENYFNGANDLDKAFQNKFGKDVPDVLNANHRMLIIGSRIDASTERIMNYLSENYGVGINAVTFTFYEKDGNEFLSRNMIIEEDEAAVQQARNSRSKRKPPLTIDDFKATFTSPELLDLFNYTLDHIAEVFDGVNCTRSTVSYTGHMDYSINTIFAIEPFKSSDAEGISFYFYLERLSSFFKMNEEEIEKVFNNKLSKDNIWNVKDGARRGFLTSKEMIDEIVGKLKNRVGWES